MRRVRQLKAAASKLGAPPSRQGWILNARQPIAQVISIADSAEACGSVGAGVVVVGNC